MEDMEDEDEKLLQEGEAMEELAHLSEKKIGYDENDYVTQRSEYANCIHEYVAPKGFKRPEFKRPSEQAKEYKFTLDIF